MKIDWYPRALDDLENLREYIARDDPGAAAVVVQRLRDAVETLSDFPELGRQGRHSGTREFIVPRMPYIVAYRASADTVGILRVLHGARRWPRV